MRRSSIVALAILLAAAITAWVFHGRPSRPSFPGDREGLVTLRIEAYEPGQLLEQGVPGFLRVEVSSPMAERLLRRREGGRQALALPEMRVGTDQDPWWKGLRLTGTSGEREEELAFDVIKGRHPGVRLDRGEVGYALLAIRPDVPLAEGSLVLTAHLRVRLGSIGEVETEGLPLPVLRGALSDARKEGLLSLYYRETGRADEAVRAAERAIVADPEQMEGYVLKAEALEEMGRYVEARQAYVEAVDHFPADSYEPPSLYRAAIERLNRRIAEGPSGE